MVKLLVVETSGAIQRAVLIARGRVLTADLSDPVPGPDGLSQPL